MMQFNHLNYSLGLELSGADCGDERSDYELQRAIGRSGSTKNFYIANKWYVQVTKYPVLLSILIDRKCRG